MKRSPTSAGALRGWHLWLAVAALLIAVALGSRGMSSAHLWWDEHFTVTVIGARPYGPLTIEHLTRLIGSDAGYHTPTFYALLAGWSLFLGDTQFGLRLFPLFLGMIALALIYRAGVWLGGRRLGLVALCILAATGFILDQMTELRTYTLFALLGGVIPALYWRLISRPISRRTVIPFVLCGIALLYTHYYSALLVATIGLYHLLCVPKNRQWWQVTGAAVLVLIAFLPWLPAPLSTVGNETSGWRFGVMTLPQAVETLLLGLTNGVLPFLLLIALGMWAAWRIPAGRFMVFVALGFVGLMLLMNQIVPVLATWRYGIPVWSFAALLAAYGIVWLVDQYLYGRWIAGGLLAAWWIMAGVAMWGSNDYHDVMFGKALVPFFRPNLTLYDAVRTIERRAVPETDVVLYDVPLQPWGSSGSFEYYTRDWTFPRTQTAWFSETTQAEIHQRLIDYTRNALRVFWLYEDQTPIYHGLAFNDMISEQAWTYCASPYTAPDLQADLYARHAMCCGPSETPLVRFEGQGVALDDWDVFDQSREKMTLITSWQVADTVPTFTYSIGWYLFDANTQLVLQQDVPLPAEAHRCLTVPLNVADLTPGTYRLMVAVYDVASGERLPSAQSDDSVSPNLISLGYIQFEE